MVVKTKINTTLIYSDDSKRRYMMTIEWDKTKDTAAVIMLSAGTSDGIVQDHTTAYTISNLNRLGYGSVRILNLYTTINNGRAVIAEDSDKRNITYIANAAKEVDTVIYAAGTGHANNKRFRQREREVMDALKPYEDKLMCITDGCGGKFYHPLYPKVREWHLEHFKIADLVGTDGAIQSKIEQGAENVVVQNKNTKRPKNDDGFISISGS